MASIVFSHVKRIDHFHLLPSHDLQFDMSTFSQNDVDPLPAVFLRFWEARNVKRGGERVWLTCFWLMLIGFVQERVCEAGVMLSEGKEDSDDEDDNDVLLTWDKNEEV
ncbi:unnamed protein product [Eruca vesicaria subsp. sativa]|uniref:Uncharacterized protein n=1 Tax=Eruca vesicaria subsp. sativa TaxID=29727 RepID=A0ABC8KJJ2_ERUVS|nr:unnamed protein product [Eruca vesicaria subsp. sativa]